jgi:hypothetical protein
MGVDCPRLATNVDVVRLLRPPGGQLDSTSSGMSGACVLRLSRWSIAPSTGDEVGCQAAGHPKIARAVRRTR